MYAFFINILFKLLPLFKKFELTEYPTGRYFKFQSTKGSTSKAATTVGEINVYGALNEE